MKFSRQTTLRSSVTLTGVGVHSGAPVNLTLGRADINTGFVFIRTGLDGADREVQAVASAVTATELATVLGRSLTAHWFPPPSMFSPPCAEWVSITSPSRLNGPEVPIMDGSAAPFVAAIESAGIVQQSAPRRFIEVLKPVQIAYGASFGELRPYAAGFRAEIEINFSNPLIGRQAMNLDLTPENFRRDVCRARTFGCMKDVAALWSAGYARGASFENSVVFDEDRLLNTEGLRLQG